MLMWILWFGLLLAIAGGLPAGYVWQGKILGFVELKKAKKIWLLGMTLTIIGIILIMAGSIGLIHSKPTVTAVEERAIEEVVKAWLPWIWLPIGIILIGAIPVGLVAQSKVLDMVSLETAQKAFKISYILIGVGSIILIWMLNGIVELRKIFA
ncbi:MAG: hypothetical protein AB1414_15945 [bacterium]